MIVKIGFSGTRRDMTKGQRDKLQEFLEKHQPFEFHHGMCIGADATAHMLAYLAGVKRIIGHPCTLWKMRSQVSRGYAEVRAEKPPLERNKDIVAECDYLIACPAEMTEQLRSGTWATIRNCRKVRREGVIIFPDGTTQNILEEKR